MNNSKYIIDIGSDTIDLREVERVGPIDDAGDHSSYTVYFKSGINIEVYNNSKFHTRHMQRDLFIEAWKLYEYIKCPICWGCGKLYYRNDGKNSGIKDCYFCKGVGKIKDDDTRNPYLAESE